MSAMDVMGDVAWNQGHIRRGMADGFFREIDEELVGHMFLAMGEGLGFRLMMDSQYTIDYAVDAMFDLVARGLKKQPAPESQSLQSARWLAEVTKVAQEGPLAG